MSNLVQRLSFGIILASLSALPSFAQGTATSSLSGTAVDPAGGVIPGAAVVVTNKATSTSFNAVTNETGAFSVPSLDPGIYTVTVSLMGFKTAVVDDIRLQPGVPASVKATLEIGSLEETVLVQASADLVNTQTPTVSATLNVDQINQMPLADPQRAQRRDVPDRREHGGRQPRRQPSTACRSPSSTSRSTASATTINSTRRATASSRRSRRGRTPSKR